MQSVQAIFNNTTEAMKLLLALLVLVLIQWENVWVSVSASDSVQCREAERSALLQINASMSFPIHSLDGKWEGKECCRWERVTCNAITGHVTQLDLSVDPSGDDKEDSFDYEHGGILLNASMFVPLHQLRSLSLSGHGIYNCTDGAGLETWSNLTTLDILDLSWNSLDRSIIYDLASVPSLHTLNLSGNIINSSSLPTNGRKAWSNLTNLAILDLSLNQLDGSIIYDLASVPSLRTLDLSGNNINASRLPNNGFESWSNLTKLQMLDLSGNDLSESIISSLAKVSSLRALYLDYNFNIGVNINVYVKELRTLNLEVLSLMNCIFSGSFPYLGHWSTSLKALSLANNDLNGTLTSEGICQLKNLEELDLSGNSFTGNLPLCMGNLSRLKLLHMSYNQFQVEFPSSIFERLESLRYLDLSGNQLEGTLSTRSFLNLSNLVVLRLSTLESLNFRVEVMNLTFQLQDLELANCILDVEPTFICSQHKLRVLDLSNTHSKGPLSSVLWLLLENNTDLIKLDLHKNFFTGPLQLPFLTHEKLSILDISDNLLGGELPANFTTKLPNLLSLSLSRNYFNGPLPLMPTTKLQILDLSSNNITDDIHNSFSRIQLSIPSFLDLSYNKFYGSFTNYNMNFTPYSSLLLNNNNISGYIPFSICNASSLMLDISNNELNGVLPNCIFDYSVLKLSGNHIGGSLPLEMCTELGPQFLDFSHNKLSGSIPPCSNQSNLAIVDLSHNNLTGNFPITWLNMSHIRAIDIGENYLSGQLPINIESNLSMLLANGNMFGGPIPEQICHFRYLRILDLSHNNLSREIPSCIIDMGSIDPDSDIPNVIGEEYASDRVGELNFSDANFLLHIAYTVGGDNEFFPSFGLEMIYKGRLDYYLAEILQMECLIDLSSNKLVGNIPKDIGRIDRLTTLNLSNNHLSGAIPNSISNLHQLESLDLSHNSLTGEIPREMIELTFLTSFSVAYNNLSGPTLGEEAQFISFDNSSYEGNPNLCGPPLSRSCGPTLNTTQPSPNEMSHDRRYEGTDILIWFGSFSLFFVVSFWGFMVVLYFKRNWRYALFTMVDWYGDIIYVKVVLWVRKIGTTRTLMGN